MLGVGTEPSNKLYPEAAKKSSEKMLGLARAVPKIALHYKVSGIGRKRLPHKVGQTGYPLGPSVNPEPCGPRPSRHERIVSSGELRRKDRPAKNEAAHPARQWLHPSASGPDRAQLDHPLLAVRHRRPGNLYLFLRPIQPHY